MELSQLVGQHIMRFAYRRQELTNFQPQTGMEDLPGVNYKHPTVVTPPIRTFYNEKVRRDVKVYSNTRYLPVFTSNLFSSLGIGESYNYEYFYPNSTWKSERGIAAANAQLTSDEIETDNGYLYTIDQVIEPLHTVYEAMENDERFSIAKSIFDKFLTFTYNANASKKYAAVGDSLFTIGTEPRKISRYLVWLMSGPVMEYGKLLSFQLLIMHLYPQTKRWRNFFRTIGRIPRLRFRISMILMILWINCCCIICWKITYW